MAKDIDSARNDLLSPSEEVQQIGVRAIEILAKSGEPLAIYAVGTWHLHGSYGYELNLTKAKSMLEEACKKQVPEAMHDLAVFLESNEGSRDRNKRAFGLYAMAAIMGDRDSIGELRRCFHWGIGTYKNVHIAELIAEYLESTDADHG